MLLELSHPAITNEDSFLLGVLFLKLEELLVRLLDNSLHVLLFESAHDTEEEVSLWKFP